MGRPKGSKNKKTLEKLAALATGSDNTQLTEEQTTTYLAVKKEAEFAKTLKTQENQGE